jgi:hypothetical protein
MAEINIVKVNWVAYSMKTEGSKHCSSNNNYSHGSGTVVSVGDTILCTCMPVLTYMWEHARTGVLKYSVLMYFF